MKAIQELNNKWWYRLIKVIYLIFLVLFLVLSPIAVFYSHSPRFDNDSSYIQCANGKAFILSKNGFILYSDFMWDSDKTRAEDLCFDGVTRDTNIGNIGNYPVMVPTVVSTTENSGKYELISKYTNRNWVATIGFSLLSILVILFFFELCRRVFYYIVLGSIRPKY